MHTLFKHFLAVPIILTLLFSIPTAVSLAQAPVTETPPAIQPPAPAEIIEAINALRLSYGLPALATHSVLMGLAQRQAAGLHGHWRPYGLTLGQLLIMEGYPLAGDLTQDGYRSENWIISMTAQGAIEAWLWDDEHSNTMLSEYRSDIGAGISMMTDEWGQDQIYVVIETALQTRSGQQQADALDFLTHLPIIINGTNSINGTPVPLSKGQYIISVIKSTAMPDGDVLHEVQYGQSLWSIAITYGTTIKQIQTWNNLGANNIVYERQILLVQKGATKPATLRTQTAAVVFAKSSSPTPSPTSTRALIPTGAAAPAAGRRGSIVVILIMSVSLLIASASVGLRVKKSHKGRSDFEAMEFDIKRRVPPVLCYNHDLSNARSGKSKGSSHLTVRRVPATSVHKLPRTESSIHREFTVLAIAVYYYRT